MQKKHSLIILSLICCLLALVLLVVKRVNMEQLIPGESKRVEFVLDTPSSLAKDMQDPSFSVTGHFSGAKGQGTVVYFYCDKLTIDLSVNGKETYSSDYREFYDTRQQGIDWAMWMCPGITENDEVRITLASAGRLSSVACTNFFNEMHAGDYRSFLSGKIRENAVLIIICFLCFFSACILFTMVATCFSNKVLAPRYSIDSAFLILFGALCACINYRYVTLLIPNALVVNCFDILLQFGIILSLFCLIRDHLDSPKMRKFSQFACTVTAFLWGFCYLILLLDLFDITGFYTVSLLATLSLLIVMLVLVVVDYGKHRTRKWDRFFVSGLSLFTIAEMLNYQLSKDYWVFIFIIGLFIYSIDCYVMLMVFLRNRIEESKAQERHLVEASSALRLAQIQPHFIFNVLNTIQYLCKKDPKVEAEALDNFTRFLRINTETLSSVAMIPFGKAIEQLQYYLSLEKLRFPSVQVRFDITINDFSIPSLTLQPIVENAIRYGASVREEWEVVISTREEGKRIIISVHDNGNGDFEPASIGENEGQTHVGIGNVRERIEKICGGTLDIVHTREGTTMTKASLWRT